MKKRIVRLERKPVETLNIHIVHHWSIQVVDDEDEGDGLW